LTAQGAKEIGNYLFAATLIIIFVFLPLLTIEGIGGRMFRPTAFAVAAALFGSLIINITLQPVLMSIFNKPDTINRRHNRFVESLTGLYERLIKSSFTHKKILLGVSLGIVVLAIICFHFLGKEFVPVMDEGSLVVSTVMLPETSLEESVRIGKQVSGIIRSFPGVLSVTRTTGMAEASEHVHPVNHSHYMVELKPKGERKQSIDDLTQAMRGELDKIPGIVYIFEQPIANKLAEMITGSEGEIAIKLFGKDLQILGEKIEDIKGALAGIKGAADLQVEQTAGIPQMEIKLDREKLARFGIRVEDAADMIEIALNGLEVTNVYEEDRVTAVLLRLSEDFRRDEDSIKNMLIDTMGGQRIPLSQLADISFIEGPQTIFRENLMRRKIILCNIVGRDIGSFVDEARKVIARQVSLPQGYYITFGGQFESQQKSMKQLSIMMLIAALIVFVILFSSLGSFRQSFLVLSTVPLTFSGGIIGLYISGQTLNVSSLIGLIALFGISLQNGIILVGKINKLRKEGIELHQAVLQGAIIRFRPIFMTELILILGVLPLILGSASGSELHQPLAVVYIGGFLAAIFYEQFVLPVFYEVLTGLKKNVHFK
ncbi:MAG: efflux RND transporter permease subunit, partial [Acidobacteria bacterium]|nr:efflux RND transporter permease subunit [Acidobacteriota bacterium]